MKKTILEFIRRGMIAMGIGPIVLAIIYLILQHNGILQTLDVGEVCVGIFSLSALAFVAGGLNALYQIERLPLMVAILIHGAVLYATYLCVYLSFLLFLLWVMWSFGQSFIALSKSVQQHSIDN